MTVTILTPTYNRRNKLNALWNSLVNQSNKDFEWLVVDDGSTDDTKEFVEHLRRSSDFPIRYIYKENGGKHTALNAGIETIESELTFIVDSDDSITKDSISSILSIHKKYKDNPDICGYAFLRSFPDGRINGKEFRKNEMIVSYIDSRVNSDDTYADKAEVFKTSCLKEFPFPEYPGEHFLGEDLIWIRMARKYNMVHINQPIYIGNYMDDGLTKNRRKHNIASPTGCMNRAAEFMKSDIKFKYRIKGGLQYVAYGSISGHKIKDLIKRTDNKIIFIACVIPGIILKKIWDIYYN